MKKIQIAKILALIFICIQHYYCAASVLVNEFSQGLSGSKEYIEFVVYGQRTCHDSCADVRGWIFDDNNGWYGAGALSTGYYRFKHDPAWACLPFGSIIVVYNPADLNVAVPPDDPYDANGDHVYILPVSSPLIEFNSSTVYSNTGFGPSLNWDGIVLNNTNDAIQTIDPNNLTVAAHAVSYGAAYSAPVNITPSGGVQTVYYLTNGQYNTTSAWAKGNVSTFQTPGAANTPANAAWLSSMNQHQGGQAVIVTVTDTICASQLPYIWNGVTLSAGGSHIAQYIATSGITGCDSTTVLDLVAMPEATVLTIDTQSCGSIVFEGKTYWQNSIVEDTFHNQFGCDSIYRIVNITIRNDQPAYKTIDTFACDQLRFEGQLYDRDTILQDQFSNIYGCDSIIRTVNIVVEHFELKLAMDPELPYSGELVQFKTKADIDYEVTSWQPATLFPSQHVKEHSAVVAKPATIIVTAQGEHGCMDSASVHVDVLPLLYDVFAPNAFSPNGDGLNDYFEPQIRISRAYSVAQLQIFDRWGKSVYSSTGNDKRWNGNYPNGTPADGGTYHYRIVIKFADGKTESLKGDMVLVR